MNFYQYEQNYLQLQPKKSKPIRRRFVYNMLHTSASFEFWIKCTCSLFVSRALAVALKGIGLIT